MGSDPPARLLVVVLDASEIPGFRLIGCESEILLSMAMSEGYVGLSYVLGTGDMGTTAGEEKMAQDYLTEAMVTLSFVIS